MVMTIFAGKKNRTLDIPFTETVQTPPAGGWQIQLDQLRYWVLASIVLVALVYGPFIYAHFPPNLSSPGLQYP